MAVSQDHALTASRWFFSRLCEAGHAKVFRCTRRVATPADLMAEAEALWKAEQPGAAVGRIAADWGCVALLLQPGAECSWSVLQSMGRPCRTGAQLWTSVSQTQEEGHPIGEDGILIRIDLFMIVQGGEPVDIDLLLVTANDPRINASARSNYPGRRVHCQCFWKCGRE